MFKREVVFLDKENHRAKVTVEITNRNGYPEFTASAQFLGSYGQCLDKIVPANEEQAELIALWNKYHLKNVSKMHNFDEHLEGIIARIEYMEKTRPASDAVGDDATLEAMEQAGIDADSLGAVKAYIALGIGDDDLSDFEEAYQGKFRDDEEFAREQANQLGLIDDDMQWPHSCIDWEQAASDLMMDYSEQDGYYFRNL